METLICPCVAGNVKDMRIGEKGRQRKEGKKGGKVKGEEKGERRKRERGYPTKSAFF